MPSTQPTGLHLISSNRIESLLATLADRIFTAPLASPLDPERVIVQNRAMGRWINLQLARRQGIACNIDYPLPASWLWSLTRELLDEVPEEDPLGLPQAGWQIYRQLPGLLTRPAFAPLQQYLQDDRGGIKQWQLSSRIADLFDRYQFYRPKMIRDWSAGKDTGWQAQLWRELTCDLQQQHRVAIFDRLLLQLQAGNPSPSLPTRISLFAISSLPPLFIDLLQALAGLTAIDLYLHSPTDHYWADLKSRRTLSRMRLEQPDQASYFDTGNELLASWGRQGQAFQDLLLSNDNLQAAESEQYQPPSGERLLGALQQAIFALDETPATASADGSLQLHLCHSELRECQVLHDQLLTMLDQDAQLRPEDILVMIPEIARYAPYIEAVFQRSDSSSRPFIPWNLSDIPTADEHPLVRTFLQLLRLPQSRFARTEILSLLDVPEITARFHLNAEECGEITRLLDQANLRWGIDAAHKQQLELPPTGQNSWRQVGQRLFAGYALGEQPLWNGIAPLAGMESHKAAISGRFWQLFERLQHYRGRLAQPHRASTWQLLLNQLLDDLFSSQEDDGLLQQIRDTIDELLQQAGDSTLSPALLQLILSTGLQGQGQRGRYFSGGVTFCGMQPMRSLPFPVICLLGMNDQAFPRRDRPLEFDHTADDWRPGDPRKGDEDRYLMLETLLCARQTLYISYTGRDIKDNSERQPSVLVRELVDFIDEKFPPPDDTAPLSRLLTHLHPMQPFSAGNFDSRHAGYDRYWCDLANRLQQPATAAAAIDWPEQALPLPRERDEPLALAQLQRFIQHPVRYFFNQQLGIWLESEQVTDDEEPFALDQLQLWQLKAQLVEAHLQQQQLDQPLLAAQGVLPHGSYAEILLDQATQQLQPLLQALQPWIGVQATPQPVQLSLANGVQLSGQVDHFRPQHGLLHYSPSRFNGKRLLAHWLDHLLLCAGEHLTGELQSLLLCSDRVLRFTPLSREEALQQLLIYCDWLQQGLQRPLPLFPGASYAWAASSDPAKGRSAALKAWHGSSYNAIPGDRDDEYIQLALRGVSGEPVEHPQFVELASAFYARALRAGEPQ